MARTVWMQRVRQFGSKFSGNKKAKSVKVSQRDGSFDNMLRAIRGTRPAEVQDMTHEEAERNQIIGREYNRQTTIRENQWRRDIDLKIKLKWAAIQALPDELLNEALEPDTTLFPYERRVMTWTPPIPELEQLKKD